MLHFDFGLGLGIRNKLSHSLALGQTEEARSYLSSGYFVIFIQIVILATIFFTVNIWLDWRSFLNAPFIEKEVLKNTVLVLSISVFLTFFLNIINSVFYAKQKPAYVSFITFIGAILSLLLVLLVKLLGGGFFWVGASISIASVVIYTIVNIFAYKLFYRDLLPNIRCVSLGKIKSVGVLGIEFFVLQLGVLVMLNTSNILMAKLYSPIYVTDYHVLIKYYSIILIVSSLVLGPMWSAITKYYASKNFPLLRKAFLLLLVFHLFLIPLIFLMFKLSNQVIPIWTNCELEASNYLNPAIAIYTVIMLWNNLFATFLNGMSILRMQMLTSFVGILIFASSVWFLSVFLAMGPESIVLAATLSFLPFSVFGSIVTWKHVFNSRKRQKMLLL